MTPLLRQRNPEARARAEEVAREMGALSLRLHTALVRARLRDVVGRYALGVEPSGRLARQPPVAAPAVRSDYPNSAGRE